MSSPSSSLRVVERQTKKLGDEQDRLSIIDSICPYKGNPNFVHAYHADNGATSILNNLSDHFNYLERELGINKVSSKRLTVIEKLSEIRDLVKSFLPTKVDLESLVKDIRTVVSRQQAIETVLAENDKLKEDLKRVSLRLAAVESQLPKISESRSSSVDVGVSQIHSKLEILDQKLTRLIG
jgi:hypothetical protein